MNEQTAVAESGGPFSFMRKQSFMRHAINLWCILAIVASVKAVVQPDHKTVFPCFADSSRNWWADQTMYDSPGRITGYRYGPTFAVLVSPFAAFSNSVGGILWNLASVTTLVLSIRSLTKHVLPGEWTERAQALLLILTLVGSARGIWSAQSNSFVFAFAAFGLTSIARNQFWRASLWLAACVTIKIWPMALVLLLMACFPRQLIGRFTLAISAFFALPFATRPVDIVLRHYNEWFTLLTGPYRTLRQGGYRDLYTILESFLPTVNDNVYTLLQLSLAGAACLWCLWRSRHETKQQLLTSVLSIWLTWQLLVGPGTERLTFQLAAPILSWAVIDSLQKRKLIGLSLAAWASTCVLGWGAVERALLPYLPFAPGIIVSGTLFFLAWQIANVLGNKPQSQVRIATIKSARADTPAGDMSQRNAA